MYEALLDGSFVRMTITRLPYRAVFCIPPAECKKPLGRQQIARKREITKYATNIGKVNVSHVFLLGVRKSRQSAGWRH